jgi:tetratricopeptide (TPR) repeat protein
MEEYLLGVEAEPLRAEDALAHYGQVLKERPDSFWGHYGSAKMAHRLGHADVAAIHLRQCIAQRPENATLRTKLAGCLYLLHQYDAALQECNQALASNPDEAQTYGSRALIRSRLGQDPGAQADVSRYELLTRRLGQIPAWRLRLDWFGAQHPEGLRALGHDPAQRTLAERVLSADPEDVDLRVALASQLETDGRRQEALAEYNKILEINPDHLRARYLRATLLYTKHQGTAHSDYAYLLDHPRYPEVVGETTVMLYAFFGDSAELLQRGAAERALAVAQRGLSYARRFNDPEMQGRMHYALACAYAMGARTSPEQLQQAATHLLIAGQYNREFLGSRGFWADPFFEVKRAELALLIPRLTDELK